MKLIGASVMSELRDDLGEISPWSAAVPADAGFTHFGKGEAERLGVLDQLDIAIHLPPGVEIAVAHSARSERIEAAFGACIEIALIDRIIIVMVDHDVVEQAAD